MAVQSVRPQCERIERCIRPSAASIELFVTIPVSGTVCSHSLTHSLLSQLPSAASKPTVALWHSNSRRFTTGRGLRQAGRQQTAHGSIPMQCNAMPTDQRHSSVLCSGPIGQRCVHTYLRGGERVVIYVFQRVDDVRENAPGVKLVAMRIAPLEVHLPRTDRRLANEQRAVRIGVESLVPAVCPAHMPAYKS
jgi:hypothetical protein